MSSIAPTIAVLARALSADLRRAAEDARTLGFDGLTLEPSQLDESARSQSGRREVARIVVSRGLKLTGLRLELAARALLESARADRALAEALRTIELTAGLRAGVVSLDLGSLPDVAEKPAPPQKPASLDAGLLVLPSAEETARYGGAAPGTNRRSSTPGDFSLVHAFIDELARFADRFGVKLALGSSLSPLASLHHAMRDITLPLIGLDLDPSALLSDSWTLDDAFEKFAGRLLHVRGRDAVRGAGGRSRPAVVGEGDVRWDDVLAALRDADCESAITLDPIELSNPRAGAIAGLRHLRALLA